jgi:gluconolactonase
MKKGVLAAVVIGVAAAAGLMTAARRVPADPAAAPAPAEAPSATVDLTTPEGVALVKGEWRYSDTKIVEVDFTGPGPDGQPTGAPVRTYDYTPKAGGAAFDDRNWPVIAPATLSARRSTGRICFNWYRIAITIPERIGTYDPTGATVTFETALDDYAEVWVDGELPRALGQTGGSVVGGCTTSSRAGRSSWPSSASTGRCRTRPRTSSGCGTRGSTSLLEREARWRSSRRK